MVRLGASALLATAALVVPAQATAPAATQPVAHRVTAGGGVTVQVPAGWHLIRRSLTDVTDPAQRVAMASFAVRLAPRPCECGMPNVAHFPRAGAFLFVWEYAVRRPGNLRRLPSRPARFHISDRGIGPGQCAGPSDGFAFRYARRAFQVEVYLGPDASRATRHKMAAALESLRATPGRVT